jgi:hypothetical protein
VALQSEQVLIASVLGYTPVGEQEGSEQFSIDADFQDAPKGSIPSTGNVRRSKQGVLRCFWIPAGGNYSTQESEDLTGWYDVPTLEDVEEQVFDSVAYTPCGDEVEPDHVDSWLRILGLI